MDLAGHVDDAVDLPEMRDRIGDDTRDVVFLERVAGPRKRRHSRDRQKGGRRRGGLAIDVGDNDARAFAGEKMGDRAADIRTRAEDDRNLSVESVHDQIDAPLALALNRQVFGVFEPAPVLGRPSIAHRLHLAPENLAQQEDAGVGFAEPLLGAIDDRALTHHGDIVLRRRELERWILRPFCRGTARRGGRPDCSRRTSRNDRASRGPARPRSKEWHRRRPCRCGCRRPARSRRHDAPRATSWCGPASRCDCCSGTTNR